MLSNFKIHEGKRPRTPFSNADWSYGRNLEALMNKSVRKTFADSVTSMLLELLECTVDAMPEWRLLRSAVGTSAACVYGWK